MSYKRLRILAKIRELSNKATEKENVTEPNSVKKSEKTVSKIKNTRASKIAMSVFWRCILIQNKYNNKDASKCYARAVPSTTSEKLPLARL